LIVKSAEEVIKEFIEAYNRNPKGWHFLFGYDSKGRLNIYIGNKNEDSIWVILTEPHWGIGARIDDTNIEKFVKEKEIEFGLRQVPNVLAKSIMKELVEFNEITPKTKEKIIEIVKNYPPRKESELKGGIILQGPSLYMPRIETIDEKIAKEMQKKFEEELRKRLTYIG
jgi:hypothetical protein